MNNVPMELPKCEQHGAMTLREMRAMTQEQAFCGTWYDCERCKNSVLFPSAGLTAQNEAMIDRVLKVRLPDGEFTTVNKFNYNLAHSANGRVQCNNGVWIKARNLQRCDD